MRFLFTCGGTAGHINPALGVAGRLMELMPDCEILFIGAKGMMETKLVPREGFEIKTVTVTNLSRSMKPKAILHNLATVKNVLFSTAEAKRIVKAFKPDCAIGTGGYVCYPVLKAAHSLGVPTLVHESNAVPGLTTKLLANIVSCVMVGFEEAGANYKPGTNVVYTGTPVRTDFHRGGGREAKLELGLDPQKPLLLSVWGSLGSDYMNGVMESFIKEAFDKKEINLIHSAGSRGYARLNSSLTASCGEGMKDSGIDVREYIYDMPRVMAAADLIMCRSGASTLGELEALGKPAILVPSPNVTNNHQEKNARVLEKCGAAKVLTEGSFTPESLYELTMKLLSEPETLAQMSKAMGSRCSGDATEKIADIVLSCIKQ